ncbi:MAG: putative metalloprotease with PDZ domain [Ulvibacter sp.]|jgi:predicted metalloprotease with PDZ domain
MKLVLSTLIIVLSFAACGPSAKSVVNNAADKSPILAHLDLTNVTNDMVPVIINPGRFTQEIVKYRLPKVVQGTYAVSDFGYFIENFKAVDYDGNELLVTKTDTNTWTISDAAKLDIISYDVNDSFDVEGEGNSPFSPSGTNIEPDNYVLNLHGFIGYFDSLKSGQYTVNVTAPVDFVRTSALQKTDEKTSDDGQAITTTYFAPRYFDVTDNPMMYGKLAVEEFMVGDVKIVLSVYSPSGVHSAASLKETIFTMMEGQKAYLGDINSTSRYDIYLYLSRGEENSPRGFGALEHHTSTVVVMPESMPAEGLAKNMVDIVAHEFFHIVSPLSVHSEDVHYFDYAAPTFSKHLWMYEGVTEYFAQHFQVYEGLITETEFYNIIQGKIATSLSLDDTMSFTTMSENVLEAPYSSNYYNVYQKGALIGMCIDILMREESNGKRSMLSLMKELSMKYGKNKPFVDDMLIDEITKMTYPSIGAFLKTHVEGTTPIDYNVFFDKVGLIEKETETKGNFLLVGGSPIVSGSPDKGIFFTELVLKNSFWAEQGIQNGDIIKEVNNTAVSLENANSVFQKVLEWQVGDEIQLKLERDGEEIIIKTVTTQPLVQSKGMSANPDASDAQINLRKSWLKG